jgi:hypothetical protein
MSLIDFKTVNDSGLVDANSVQPYADGEYADALILTRPPENLRVRTDALRVAADNMDALSLHDRSMVMIRPYLNTGAGEVPLELTWGGANDFDPGAGVGTGNFTTNGPLGLGVIVAPSVSAIKNTAGVMTANSHSARLSYISGADWFSIRAYKAAGDTIRHMWEGAGNIYFIMYIGAGAHAPYVTVTGAGDPANGPIEVSVELDDDGAGGTNNTFDELETAVNTACPAFLLASQSGTWLGAVVPPALIAETLTRRRLFEFPTYGVGGLDATGFYIPEATWAGAPSMADGDVLAIDFSTVTERRGFTTPVVVGDLVALHDDPATPLYTHSNAGGNQIFPLCKIYADRAYFFNGIVIPRAATVTMEHDYANREAYAAHVAGTGDIHPISHIVRNTRSFVTVGPTGSDYLTIQSAIDALAGTVVPFVAGDGGTIFIRNGTYASAGLNIPSSATAPISFVGESRDRTIIALTSEWNVACAENHQFQNLSIYITGAAEHLFTTETAYASGVQVTDSGGAHRMLQFSNCNLYRGAPACAAGFSLFCSGISTSFENCLLHGLVDAVPQSVDVAFEVAVTTNGVLNVHFKKCYIQNMYQIFYNPTAWDMELVTLTDNKITSCGFATVAPANDWVYLVDSSNVACDCNYHIAHNAWASGTYTNQCGGFCSLSGHGEVAYNDLSRAVISGNTDADSFIIKNDAGTTHVTASKLVIHHNNLSAAVYSGGIRGQFVEENYIASWNAQVAAQYAIHVPGTNASATIYTRPRIVGNTIKCPAIPTAATTAIYVSDSALASRRMGVCVENNTIDAMPTNVTGIYLANVVGTSGQYRVTGNIINTKDADALWDTATVGIVCNVQNTVIDHNNLLGCYDGIQVTNADVTVRGNIIKGLNTLNNYGNNGVSLATNATRCIVSENNIQGYKYGICMDVSGTTGTYCLLANNRIAMAIADLGVGGVKGIYVNKFGGGAPDVGCYSHIVGNLIWQLAGGDIGYGVHIIYANYIGIGGNMINCAGGTANTCIWLDVVALGASEVGLILNPAGLTDWESKNWMLGAGV